MSPAARSDEPHLVRDRMTAPAVTLGPDVSLREIEATLEARAISAVPIVDEGALVGIVSTTDLVRAEARGVEELRKARDLMQHPVVTVEPDVELDRAARELVAARVHRLVVVQGARVVGVLSARDMLVDLARRRPKEPLVQVMTSEVQTIEVGDPIDLAISRLAAANVHGLVVVDGPAPVGVFTHAEALAARALPADLRSQPVEEVMSYETICLDAETPLHRAASYAIAMDVRRILVVERRQLIGIVSAVDLVSALARSA